MVAEKLLGCPFCGGEAYIVEVNTPSKDGGWKVCGYCPRCSACESSREPAATEAEAITAWNTRAQSSAPAVTDKQIEAAARAAFDVWWNDRGAGAEYSWLCTKANWIKQQRAALLASQSTPAPPEVGELVGYVLVPDAALKWLNGEGPDAHGQWFGDIEIGHERRYWWRKRFFDMIAAAPVPAQQEQG